MGSLDVAVIVRSAGERTEGACLALLERQAADGQVSVVRQRPFTAALRRSYEVGLDRGRAWTLCIDADVLLCSDAVSRLIALAQRNDDSLVEVQCSVLDKLFAVPRAAGNHLYRTALLERALRCIPEPGVSLRPESFVLRRMAAAGHPWVQDEAIIGLHDYAQYYRDIYRKAFVHGRKHGGYLPYLARLWRRLAATDRTYEVALWGLRNGLTHGGEVTLDADDPAFAKADQALLDHGWSERETLAPASMSPETVSAIIARHEAPPEYGTYARLRSGRPAGLGGIGYAVSYLAAGSGLLGWPAAAYWLARIGRHGLLRLLRQGAPSGRGQA